MSSKYHWFFFSIFFFVIFFILVSLFLIFVSENVLLFFLVPVCLSGNEVFLFLWLTFCFLFYFILFYFILELGLWWALGLGFRAWKLLVVMPRGCCMWNICAFYPPWRFLLNALLTFWFHLNRGGLKMDWWVWFICWVFGVCGPVVEVGSFGTFYG